MLLQGILLERPLIPSIMSNLKHKLRVFESQMATIYSAGYPPLLPSRLPFKCIWHKEGTVFKYIQVDVTNAYIQASSVRVGFMRTQKRICIKVVTT